MFSLQSIKVRTILCLVAVVFSFNSYVLYWDINESVTNQRENLEETSVLLAKSQAYAAKEHYWRVDFDAIEHIAEGFTEAPSFYSITFYDENNEIVLKEEADKNKTYPYLFSTKERITITENGESFYLGYLLYEVSYEKLHLYKKNAYLKGIGKSILLTLLLSLVLYFVIDFLITKPLKRITDTLISIASGDTSVVIPYQDKKNQIGKLALAATIFKDKTTQLIDFEVESRKDAEKANKMKDLFLARMSHELKTPLHGISGYAQLLLEDKNTPDSLKKIKVILRLTESMDRLIQNILDYSKLKSEKLKLNLQAEHLPLIVGHVKEAFLPIIKKNKNTLHTHIDKTVPKNVLLDKPRVEQILFNLIHNATKFTENGSIILSVKVEEKKERKYLLFSVSDTGIGMSEKFMSEDIFKLFTQEDEKINRKYSGTGLGLSITYQLVSLMQGKLTVTSKKDIGSTFTFTLPLEEADLTLEISKEEVDQNISSLLKTIPTPIDEGEGSKAAEYSVKESVSADQSFKKKILVVDDEAINRDILKNIIKNQGCHVTCAEDGVEALECVKKSKFDIVFMDLMMPHKDGFVASKEIRDLGYEKVQIIAVSAHNKEDIEIKCQKAGMNGFIPKPFPIDEIKKILQKES